MATLYVLFCSLAAPSWTYLLADPCQKLGDFLLRQQVGIAAEVPVNFTGSPGKYAEGLAPGRRQKHAGALLRTCPASRQAPAYAA